MVKKDEKRSLEEQILDQTQKLEAVEVSEEVNKLDSIQTDKNNSKPKKPINKKMVIILSSVASLFLLMTLIFGISSFKRNQTIKQADSLVLMEKFEDGIAIYDKLLSKKYIPAIINKRDLAIDLMESNENLEKGKEAFDDDNRTKAVKYLSKVPENDKRRYEKALEILEEIEDDAVNEIEILISEDNLDLASKMVNEYLKLYPDSIDIQNAEQDIISKRSEAEHQAKAEEQAQKDKEAAEAKAAKTAAANQIKSNEARNIAASLKGSVKSIISQEANLRNAPTLKGGIVSVIPRGTEVYIYDTQIESSNRIWCQVQDQYGDYGWISYNTMNYTIQ